MLVEICLIFFTVVALNRVCRVKCGNGFCTVFGNAKLEMRLFCMESVKPSINCINGLNVPAEILVVAENIGDFVKL